MLTLGGITLTEAGIEIPRGIEFSEFERVLNLLLPFRRHSPQWIGQILAEMEFRFGDKCWAAINPDKASLEDLGRLIAVAKLIPKENWNPQLSWTHHMNASSLPPSMQRDALAMAVDEGLNSGDFQRRVREIKNMHGLGK